MVIEVGQDYDKTPKIKCPYCTGELTLMLDGFKPDITQINKSNCPHCGAVLFTCLLIITAKSLQGLNATIQSISELFDDDKVNFVDPQGRRIQ